MRIITKRFLTLVVYVGSEAAHLSFVFCVCDAVRKSPTDTQARRKSLLIFRLCATPITIGGISRCLVRLDYTALAEANVHIVDRLTARVVKRTDLCRHTMVMTWCDEEYGETWLECNYFIVFFSACNILFDRKLISMEEQFDWIREFSNIKYWRAISAFIIRQTTSANQNRRRGIDLIAWPIDRFAMKLSNYSSHFMHGRPPSTRS